MTPKTPWISVTHGRPRAGVKYLVFSPQDYIPLRIALRIFGEWFSVETRKHVSGVTHYMPLPKYPRE